MRSKNSARITASESKHFERVKSLPCSVCDTPGPSEAHHIKQGNQETLATNYVALNATEIRVNSVFRCKISKPAKQWNAMRALSNSSLLRNDSMPNSILAPVRAKWYELRFTEDARKVRCECKYCSRPMWFPPSKAGKYVTCGGDCTKALHSLRLASREKQCETCGNYFVPRPAQIAAGQGRVCSQKCNISTHAIINSAEAHEKARKSWKATHAVNPIVKSGEANPLWTGGRRATNKRRVASGAVREARNTRRIVGGAPIESGITKKLGLLQRWKCIVCQCGIKNGYHLDHIMPLALGGTNISTNLQLLCPPCNWKKNAKHPVDFMQERGFLL